MSTLTTDGSVGTAGRHRHRHRRTRQGPSLLGLVSGTLRWPARLVRSLRPSRLPWYGALALASLLVAALVVDGLWWQSNRHARALDAARGDALVAATSAAQKVLSWDYRTLPTDIARAKAVAAPTGEFLHDYTKSSSGLLQEAPPLKAIAQTTVPSGSVVSASPDHVVVLLFADQASMVQQPGTKTPNTKIVQFRLQFGMVKQHGRWLLDTLKSL